MSTAATILTTVRDLLVDTEPTGYRWSNAELLRYLNAAQRQIVFFRPDANAVEVVHSVADTNPLRSIPTDGFKFIKVVCNISQNGDRGGRVQLVQVDVLDSLEPEWRRNVSTTASIDNFYSNYVFDPRQRKNFWLYPRPVAGRNVYILYAATPTDVAATTSNMTLSAAFDSAMVEYVLFRALSKEGRYAHPSDHAMKHWNNFLQMLGVNAQAYDALVDEEKDVRDSG